MNITSALTFGFFGSAGRDGYNFTKKYAFNLICVFGAIMAPLLIIVMSAKIVCAKRSKWHILKRLVLMFIMPLVMFVSTVGLYVITTTLLTLTSWLIVGDTLKFYNEFLPLWDSIVDTTVNALPYYMDNMRAIFDYWLFRFNIEPNHQAINYVIVANLPLQIIGLFIGLRTHFEANHES